MLSLRARLVRLGFILGMSVLRRSRGAIPAADAPEEELEDYALRLRGQLEDLAGRLRPPRGTTIVPAADAPVRSLWVVDDAVSGHAPLADLRDGDPVHDGQVLDGPVHDGPVADDPMDAGPVHAGERVVLHVHGGAYCIGSPESHRGLAATLSRAARAAVVLPEYRLAPEHRFPAALDDVVDTWDWLTGAQGVHPSRIAVTGDSAGGGLGAALCVLLRERGAEPPACFVALSPWMDLAGTGRTLVSNQDRELWVTPSLVAPAARAYAGDTPLDDPLVSPLYADLSGFPPTLVHVGTHEVLLDDAVRFVAAARERGVDASLGRFDGLWHVFHAFPGFPESRTALQEIGAFIRRHTAARASGRSASSRPVAARPAAG